MLACKNAVNTTLRNLRDETQGTLWTKRNEARAEVMRSRKALDKAKAAGLPISIQEFCDRGGFELDGVVFHLARSVMEGGEDER